MLFALEIEDLKKDKSSTRLLLNPAGEFLLALYSVSSYVYALRVRRLDSSATHLVVSIYLFLNISFALWYSSDFVIPPKEDFRIEAFVMAKNKAQVCWHLHSVLFLVALVSIAYVATHLQHSLLIFFICNRVI